MSIVWCSTKRGTGRAGPGSSTPDAHFTVTMAGSMDERNSVDFNFKTVFGGVVVMAVAIAAGVLGGCEPPEPTVANPPPCWTFSEENYQLGAASVCLDAGVDR